jgi:hypothetical protein
MAPIACNSDSDCSGSKPKCDVTSHLCVVCIVTTDCPGVRPVCNFATGNCDPCTTNSDCTRFDPLAQCSFGVGSCAVPIHFPFAARV